MNLSKMFFLCIVLFTGLSSEAHIGGHYHKNDGTVFNSWRLKNGLQIKGNFSSGKENYIILEQEEGKLLRIPLSELVEQDRELAVFKIRKFRELNEDFESNAIGTGRNGIPLSFLISGALIISGLFFILLNAFRKKRLQPYRWWAALIALPILCMFIYACKKSSSQPDELTAAKTSHAYMDSAFLPYNSYVNVDWDSTYFYVSSNGLPAHNMMVGITNWQQQVPINQPYTGTNRWSIPLQPVFSNQPLSLKTNFMMGAVAIAVNGIPIFNALDNRGEDSYAIGELDDWGGHCGKADDYHYHIAPLHLSASSGLKPIAFALDGFAVYGTKEPDGSVMQDLDTCHGHLYNGVYHYHGTMTYPYMIGAMRGKVTLDPNTSAPQNQIIPQAKTTPLRPSTNPLNGAVITDFVKTGTDAYKLTYTIAGKPGYVAYNWSISNLYTYILTDTAGVVVSATYQR